ncbi:MAG: hypothetical protein GX492_03185 [Firmicutes bacterium]|nr:hypothetical protein [Bacillota bacterium]
MLRSRIHNVVIASALALSVALTGVVGAAFAQETAAPPEQPAAKGIAPVAPANPWFGGAQRTGWPGPLVAKIADILKMKVEDLVAAREAGKSFADIAKERSVSEAELLDALMAQVKANVDSLVASGRMTQSQADQVLANVRANLKAAITRTAIGPLGAGLRTGMGRGPGAGQRAGAGAGPGAFGRGASAGFGTGYRQGWKHGFRCGFGMGLGLGQGPAGCPFWQQNQNQTQTQTQTQNQNTSN